MRKILTAVLTASVIASISSTTGYALDPSTLPSLNNAQNADVTYRGGYTQNVQIQGGEGAVGKLNWNSFNVGSDARVNFEFTNQNQTALNKVGAAGGISEIYGTITNSGLGANTGKVLLINPNGVLFGAGANVDLNSITVSTLDGKYDANKQSLELTKGAKAGDIEVRSGANIYADKNVSLIGSNITTYAGSKISTNINAANNGVKLITSDGVNFTYALDGGITKASDLRMSSDALHINLNGDIESGNISADNLTTSGGINLNGAALKATKAEKGNDGRIYLTSNNDVKINNSTVETKEGGNVDISADKDINVKNSKIDSTGHLYTRAYYTTTLDNSKLTAKDYADIASMGKTTVQNNTNITGKSVYVAAVKDTEINNSTIESKEKTSLYGENTIVKNKSSVSGLDLSITAENESKTDDSILLGGNTQINANNVKMNNSNIVSTNVSIAANNDLELSNTGISGMYSLYQQYPLTRENDYIGYSGGNISIKANETAKMENVKTSGAYTKVEAGNIEIADSNIDSHFGINLKSTKGDINATNTKLNISSTDSIYDEYAKINIEAKENVKADNVDLNNGTTVIKAGKDINAKIKNAGNRFSGLTAEAQNNVTIETDGTLSVLSLTAKNGDMTLTADNIIAGTDKKSFTCEYKDGKLIPVYETRTNDYLRTEGDSANRAYISVKNGKFTSNTKNDSYTVTDSAAPVDKSEGYFNQKHHIEYGNGNEKFLLVTKRAYEAPIVEEQPELQVPAVDGQTAMVNKIQKQPEVYNNQVIIRDNRTTFSNVFAAASQVEIEKEKEN